MLTYIVIPLTKNSANTTALNVLIERDIGTDVRHRLQADAGWLIQFDGTTKELSDKLTITGQKPGEPSPVGPAIIAPISGYYGRGPTDMWEWLKIRFER